MWGTIANLKENLNKIALDVHDDDDDDEIFRVYGAGSPSNGGSSAVSDRRSSHGSVRSRSGIRSPLANGIDHASLPEVTLSLSLSLEVVWCGGLCVVYRVKKEFSYIDL